MRVFYIKLPIDPALRSPLPDFFYNDRAYIKLNDSGSVVSFFLQPDNSEEVLARIHFSYQGDIAKSHWKAPFGFLETNIVDNDLLDSFWKNIETRFRELGIKRLELVSWPEVYSKNSQDLWRFLEEHGFSKEYEDVNFHLLVDATPIVSHFLKPERKRLRKCIREELLVKIESGVNCKYVHQKLKEFRDKKSIPLNITEEALVRSFQRFPDRYVVFTVEKEEQTFALSVCLNVNKDIFYHFCLACDPQYNSLSPSVLLYASIYEYCQREGYCCFDFGIASIKGKKQEGLYQFKRNLGGQVSAKPTFSKRLD